MAQQNLVTLEHPDGRRYRTDSASEINLLVGSYGYQRVEESSSTTQTSNRSKRSSRPSGSLESQSPPETSTGTTHSSESSDS